MKKTMMTILTTLIISLCFASTACAKESETSFKLSGKKGEFIDFILPKIDSINKEIMTQRERLLTLEKKFQNETLDSSELAWLKKLAENYHLTGADFSQTSAWNSLKLRVDVIPPSLAVAQAATESGWGKSRFAKNGNNYFGQSCFSRGCGMKSSKKSRLYYEVKTFSSALESVRSYIYNLNSHQAYSEFRKLRQVERQKNNAPQGLTLAKGLKEYSESGSSYVNYIRKMISKQKLHELDKHHG